MDGKDLSGKVGEAATPRRTISQSVSAARNVYVRIATGILHVKSSIKHS